MAAKRKTAAATKGKRRPAPSAPRTKRPNAKKPAARPARKRAAENPPLHTGGRDLAVDEFLRNLDHPLSREIDFVRRIILGVSPAISDGIKWNSPSFRTTDWFATVNLRSSDGEDRVWLILHTGAKKKTSDATGMKVADPSGLLQWLDKNRCLVTFDDSQDIESKRAALEAIIRTWIGQL